MPHSYFPSKCCMRFLHTRQLPVGAEWVAVTAWTMSLQALCPCPARDLIRKAYRESGSTSLRITAFRPTYDAIFGCVSLSTFQNCVQKAFRYIQPHELNKNYQNMRKAIFYPGCSKSKEMIFILLNKPYQSSRLSLRMFFAEWEIDLRQCKIKWSY